MPHQNARYRRNPEVPTVAPGAYTWRAARDKYDALATSDPYHLYGISFTNAVDDYGRIKLGVYPASKSHDDPKGVFAYPIGYTVNVSYGATMKAWAIIRVPIPARVKNAVIISSSDAYAAISNLDGADVIGRLPMYGTPEHKLLEIARNNGWYTWAYNALNGSLDDLVRHMEKTGDTIAGVEGARPPAGKWYHAAKALTSDKYINYRSPEYPNAYEVADEVADCGYSHMKWGSSLRGVPYVYDVGTGSIHHAEPAQFVVLDTRIMDIVDYGLNKRSRVIVKRKVASVPTDSLETALQRILDTALPDVAYSTDDAAEIGVYARELYTDGRTRIRRAHKKHAARLVATMLANCESAVLFLKRLQVAVTLSGHIDTENLKRATPAQDTVVRQTIDKLFETLDQPYAGYDEEYVITNKNGVFNVAKRYQEVEP